MAVPVNVPNVPGVPPVTFAPGFNDLVTILESDALAIIAGGLKAPWGIYLGVIPIITGDNVVTFGYHQSYQISDFPVEAGQFQSYNKVYVPFEAQIRFSAGGTLAHRQAFLDSITAIIGNTTLYNVVTEDAVYLNVSLTNYAYNQAASNAGLQVVDVTAEQVKVIASSFLSNVLSPFSSLQFNGGVVQAIAPLISIASSVIGSIF